MRIIGIDPGIATTGYGIVDSDGHRSVAIEYGCVLTDKDLPGPQRLQCIYRELSAVVSRFEPQVMAVEKLFFNKNINSAMQVGEARGVAILTGMHAGLDIFEYTPLQVKQSVVGFGRAEKKQVQQMVKVLLNLTKIPRPDDAADALAVALCHAHSGTTLNALTRRGTYV
ncbi:crossover junction endodeoxyribonuclease RuvC [Dethiobacter alkaliphilus]|uniref:crossover junction endodeoxyribonuclease RuvC n=1 Tax=Dethiobacter alkaliphilus TaxID=427926 RepID=UPI002227245F|nr:crossover junction endodeoxyribonuclease RuvC [Dethiobacter alkaliphilus]MCW3490802.1 crossover junction endodeoxyribonuclease RuvC [Dethiobacter alkaliphilus]